MKVTWVLTIAGGTTWAGRPAVCSLHESEEAAELALWEYVKRNWNLSAEELAQDEDGSLDREEEIRDYFDDARESYEIGILIDAKSPARARDRAEVKRDSLGEVV
jgi:hypothetical protein